MRDGLPSGCSGPVHQVRSASESQHADEYAPVHSADEILYPHWTCGSALDLLRQLALELDLVPAHYLTLLLVANLALSLAAGHLLSAPRGLNHFFPAAHAAAAEIILLDPLYSTHDG